MAKILYLVTIYYIIGLSLAHQNHNNAFYNFFRPLFTQTSICTNPTNNTAQLIYLSKMLTLINTLQNNATYNAILQVRSSNFLAYIKNPTNQGILYTNCSNFVTGLKAAKLADTTAARARLQINLDIYQRLRQVPRDAVGSNGPNDMDDGGSHEFYC